MKYARIALIGGMFIGAATLFVAGCSASDATTQDDMVDRYNQPNKALSDPFGYSPDMSDSDMTDMSKGGNSDASSGDFDQDFNHQSNGSGNP